MEKGLLLDGVDVFRHDLAVIHAVEGAVLVFPGVADAALARVDLAFMGAQETMDLLLFQALPKSGGVHRVSLGLVYLINITSGVPM